MLRLTVGHRAENVAFAAIIGAHAVLDWWRWVHGVDLRTLHAV